MTVTHVYRDIEKYRVKTKMVEPTYAKNAYNLTIKTLSNLNLIERVWKFVKKKCLYSKYYEKFPAFKAAISKCLGETMTTHKTELDSLLTLRFQLFQKAQFVTV